MSIGTFSVFFLIALAVCGHSLSYNDENVKRFSMDQISANEEVVTDFLGHNILGGVDSSQLCDDPYVAFCGIETRNYTRPVHWRQAYQNIRDRLINILEQPVAINEVTSLSVEKTLFSKCMKLGMQSDSPNLQATKNYLKDLNHYVFHVKNSWTYVDDQLNLRGFDYTFFAIGVERDPMNSGQNVIVIQPPSASRIKNLHEWASMVFDPKNSPDKTQIPWQFFDTTDTLVPVKRLLRRWAEVVTQSSKQRKQERVSLSQWEEVYNTRSSKKPTHSKIDWRKLITETFERFNVEVKGNTNIIVRNKEYFLSLVDLLGDATNDVIVLAIKARVILENIRLVDFKYADTLKHRKKSLFCFENTKLYGASYRLLRDLKRDNSNDEENYEILNEMILSIADVFIFNIDESNDLTPKEKRYLKAQVKSITSHAVKFKNTRNLVDDYYENYNTHRSYFVSILKYRRMLKDKELKSLTDHSAHLSGSEPFSVIDLAKARNRFILNMLASSYLLSKQPIPSVLQKEVHYGIYGVSIASFLYGLLNENRLDNHEIDLADRVNWYSHPNYPTRSLKCFVGEDIKSYGWSLASEAVTQIFGAHFAYNAVLDDYGKSESIRPKEFLIINPNSELQAIDADKLFFMSYGRYHCYLGQKVLRTVLLNSKEYNFAFQCESERREFQPQCSLNAFQMQSKRRFVNKPF